MAKKLQAIDWGLLLLRLGAGLMLFAFHGWGKLIGAYAYHAKGEEWRFVEGVGSIGFPVPALFATVSALTESVGGLLLAAGLWTRCVALLIAFNMTVAVYRHLAGDLRFELAALYWLASLMILLIGPGALSLDARLRRR